MNYMKEMLEKYKGSSNTPMTVSTEEVQETFTLLFELKHYGQDIKKELEKLKKITQDNTDYNEGTPINHMVNRSPSTTTKKEKSKEKKLFHKSPKGWGKK